MQLVQYQQQRNLAFMLLVKSQLLDEPLDIDELMCYSLASVPHSLGTPDGFFAKTNKAAMLHFLLEAQRMFLFRLMPSTSLMEWRSGMR